jgi:uncharacterized protein (TIGR02600 family)
MKKSTRSGFALVVVLGVIVLVVVLVVGFLSRVTTDRVNAGSFASAVTARQYGDMAVSLVQSMINHATTQGSDVAWVSQPGMVRTFDSGGDLRNAYKLYSADNLINPALTVADDLPPGTWAEDTATWVDLNAPVTANGIRNYPVMDPAGAQAQGGIGPVEGFAIQDAPGVTGGSYQQAPMPLRWLYILQNGTMAAASGTGKKATVPGATAANPIIGRVAFWTDDESAKLNVNTAGGGTGADDTFWDLPSAYNESEVYGLALKQPTRGEFQRYPGHPGTVMLASVFPGLPLSDYLQMTPRYAFGGSEGALRVVDNLLTPITSPPKTERLYPALDELAFDKTRAASTVLDKAVIESRKFFLTAHSRAPETNLSNLPRVAMWPVYQLNAAGAPDLARTTAYDRLIAFCSSAGFAGSGANPLTPYFIQRKNAYALPDFSLNTATGDLALPRNAQLYAYLQHLTGKAVPGFGGDFKTKYADDRDQILTQMVDYIRSTNLYDDQLAITNRYTNPPGATSGPGNFADNYGVVIPGQGPNKTRGFGRWTTMYQFSIAFICNADPANTTSNDPAQNKMLQDPPFNADPATVVPLVAGQKRIQAAIIPQFFSPSAGWRLFIPSFRFEIEGLEQFQAEGHNLGFPSSAYVDQNVSGFTLGGRDFGGAMVHTMLPAFKQAPYPASAGGTIPSKTQKRSGENTGNYPFVGRPVTVNDGTFAFTGGKITIKIYADTNVALPAPIDPTKPVQVIELNVPGGTFPTPTLVSSSGVTNGTRRPWSWYSPGWDGKHKQDQATTDPPNSVNQTGRMHVGFGGGTLLENGDTVRSLHPAHGDYRLLLAHAEIDDVSGDQPATFYKHRWYDDPAQKIAAINLLSKDVGGKVITTTPATQNPSGASTIALPHTPNPHVTGGVLNATATGDFDSGPANITDGAYINKPDEGNIIRALNGGLKNPADGRGIPYYNVDNNELSDGPTFFSPNRVIPSPVMFGSLPTGVKARVPWRTLLFRPLAAAESTHIGATGPKDHLLLDNFWMPVVEPYAISDRFSTAGKINLNCQILPFTYIQRTTGLRAILKAEKMSALANTQAGRTANIWSSPNPGSWKSRYKIDADATLDQLTKRFEDSTRVSQGKNVFLTPSEICELYLVPEGLGQTATTMSAWWNGYRQTGDNLREKIYATIYPKLTTKSNTYTVHFRAQPLKKLKTTDPAVWEEGKDAVVGEYRGSTKIERYINPTPLFPTTPPTPAAFPPWIPWINSTNGASSRTASSPRKALCTAYPY